MRVSVDLAVCTGHALCAAVAPDVFDLDETGLCLVTRADVPAERERQAQEGADACPERAITILR